MAMVLEGLSTQLVNEGCGCRGPLVLILGDADFRIASHLISCANGVSCSWRSDDGQDGKERAIVSDC